jgi:hypothetical protein
MPGMVSHAMALTSWLRGVTRSSTSLAIGAIIEAPTPCSAREATNVCYE